MDSFSSRWFGKFASKVQATNKEANKPNSRVVQGSPEEVAKIVHEDILLVKSEIKNYNELTGLFTTNCLYSKLYKLLEADHAQELDDLNRIHEGETCSLSYQRSLLALYKKHVADYSNFLDMLKNNYNHGIYEKKIVNYRLTSVSDLSDTSEPRSRNSVFSTTPSHRSSVSDPSRSSTEEFEKISDDAPDHLRDPISFNLFGDAVIAPSGITYDKAALLEHLHKKGKFDPLTREPLSETQLYPNLAVKDSVEQYISAKQEQLKSKSL